MHIYMHNLKKPSTRNVGHSIILRHMFFKKWKMIAASEWKSVVSINWCGIWLPSLFQPSFMGVGTSVPIYNLPNPQGSRKPISLKYHIELAVVPWKHKIMKSVHIYMHNELKAFFALCIYICIMCWQVIWEKNGKAVKGLSEGTLWKFCTLLQKVVKTLLT